MLIYLGLELPACEACCFCCATENCDGIFPLYCILYVIKMIDQVENRLFFESDESATQGVVLLKLMCIVSCSMS